MPHPPWTTRPASRSGHLHFQCILGPRTNGRQVPGAVTAQVIAPNVPHPLPVPSQVFFIEDGVVSGMFENNSSLDNVSASFPSNHTSLPFLLQSNSPDTLYFTITINSLNTSVGLSCPAPHFGQIDPATNLSKALHVQCCSTAC